MTADQQELYDAFANLKELEGIARQNAEYFETSARQQRALEADYRERAKALAVRLGFTC